MNKNSVPWRNSRWDKGDDIVSKMGSCNRDISKVLGRGGND